jgi:hypothetical protein
MQAGGRWEYNNQPEKPVDKIDLFLMNQNKDNRK